MDVDTDLVVRSVISMLVITLPFDPVKVLVFNAAIADPPSGGLIAHDGETRAGKLAVSGPS